MTHLSRAIDVAGSQTALAKSIGVVQQQIWNWMNRAGGRVPAEHCPVIEAVTREIAAERGDPALIVTCEELRPDVAWSVLRQQPSREAA